MVYHRQLFDFISEFFAKAEGSESTPVVFTPQQMQVIACWSVLRPDQQEAVLNLLNPHRL